MYLTRGRGICHCSCHCCVEKVGQVQLNIFRNAFQYCYYIKKKKAEVKTERLPPENVLTVFDGNVFLIGFYMVSVFNGIALKEQY